MSRSYKWYVEIEDMADADRGAVYAALEDTWTELNGVVRRRCTTDRASYSAVGEWSLGGGRSVTEEARAIREAVWRAVGAYVDVRVGAVCMENPAWILGTAAEGAAYLATFPACPRCGRPVTADPEDCGAEAEVCARCEDERPVGCDAVCPGCRAWFAREDPDDRGCPECLRDAAEIRQEGER
jgi:hypothetical protein